MRDKIQQLWIRHLYKKACKAMARFDNAIGSNEVNFGSVLEKIKYDDTDSIADGMKYTE